MVMKMKLKNYINHLKHKSLYIELVDSKIHEIIYQGTLGVYLNWIHKGKYEEYDIEKILFFNESSVVESMTIYLY